MTKALIVLLLSLATALAGPSDPEPNNWWLDIHNTYVANTIGSGGNIPILFYGDSITEGWGGPGKAIFDALYAPLGVENYGIGYDQTQHVLWRILNGEIDGLSPKLIVLKIGINNLGLGGNTNDEVVEGVATLLTKFRELLPFTKILLLGILPRSDGDFFARIADINIKISKFHDGSSVFFLNMFDQFSTAWGVVDPVLFNSDLLHLEPAGYEKWAEIMSPLFYQLLQE